MTYLVRLFQTLSDPYMILLKNINVINIVRRRISIIFRKKRKFSIIKINLDSEKD